MKLFYFPWTRKPEYIKSSICYNDYWKERGFKIYSKLKERDSVILDYIKEGSRVIDIGCGNSLLPVKLKEKKCDITVADVSDKVLEGYKKYDINGQILDLNNTEKVSLAEKYDYIILSEVLEHLVNPELVINKLKKSAKNIIITIPNSGFYRYRWHLMFGGRFFTQWVYHPSEHLRFWTHKDFLDWIKAMDLELIDSVASNGFDLLKKKIDLKNIWKNLFGHQMVYFCRNKE